MSQEMHRSRSSEAIDTTIFAGTDAKIKLWGHDSSEIRAYDSNNCRICSSENCKPILRASKVKITSTVLTKTDQMRLPTPERILLQRSVSFLFYLTF
jgi:hypothetical protein